MAEKLNFKFTKRDLLSLPKPKSGWKYYQDELEPGLCLRISAAGSRIFELFKRIDGMPRHIKIGKFPDVAIDEARNAARVLKAEIAQGINPANKRRLQREESTFKDLFDEYVNEHAKKTRTPNMVISQFNRHLSELGQKRVSSITPDDVSRLHAKITISHPILANRICQVIHRVFNWGNKTIKIKLANPAAHIQKNPEMKRRRFIRSAELPRFFKALEAEPDNVIRDFFWLALLTGARRSNVQAMKWSDIDWSTAEWHIPEAVSKNGLPITISLSDQAIQILKKRKPEKPQPFVLPGSGKSGHLVEPKKGWKRILIRMHGLQIISVIGESLHWDAEFLATTENAFLAGENSKTSIDALIKIAKSNKIDTDNMTSIPDLRIHDLRRTLGSWQAIIGSSLPIIGQSLGHQSISSTAIYARLSQDPVRQSVAGATEAMLNAGGLGAI